MLHFAKEQIPPAANFRSLTMYDKDGDLVENPIPRQAVGDRSRFKFADDGSLTIYLQSESPGRDKDANRLPSPKAGQFKLSLRLYGPKKAVLDGTWKPPAVQRVK